MSDRSRGLTRRDVLRGAAVAGAAALVDPSAALAATPARVDPSGGLAGTPPQGSAPVFSRQMGTLPGGVTRAIAVPQSFSLVGVEWAGPAQAQIELRIGRGDGGLSRWVTATVLGHDGDGAPADGRRFGEPIWTGPADYVQVRSACVVHGVRLHFVASSGLPAVGTAQAAAARAMSLAQPVLDAGPGQPPILARAAWARGHASPHRAPEYGTIKLAFVHHSETPNGYGAGQVPAILLSIFAYHRYVRDYFDIGYNFAVDAYGRIWEARAGGIDQPVIGAHAGGYNAESTGVVVLGSFSAVAPSGAALAALERLLAWKLALHGVPALGRVPVEVAPDGASYTAFAPGARVSLPRIAGHRDGDQTSCPGDALYARLPSLRPRVATLAGRPLRLTIGAPAAPVAPGTSVTVTGRLTDVSSGAAVAGAPIEIQQLSGAGGETTVATVSTDSAGGWGYALAPAQNVLMRALHRPAPAAASDVVLLAVAPAVTLSVDSVAPLLVSGTVAPAAPRVTIDVYRVTAPASGRRRLVASKQVTAAGGSFRAQIRRPRPGRYILVARTVASVRYVTGASPAVPVTIA